MGNIIANSQLDFETRVVSYLSGGLGALGAFIFIVTYIAIADQRTKSRQLLLFLSIADLGQALRFALIDFDHYNTESCMGMSAFGIWIADVSFLWTACISIYVYMVVRNPNRPFPTWATRFFHILSWGYPTVYTALLLYFARDATTSGSDVPWCFLDPQSHLGWRLAGHLIPLFLCWTITAIMYICATIEIDSGYHFIPYHPPHSMTPSYYTGAYYTPLVRSITPHSLQGGGSSTTTLPGTTPTTPAPQLGNPTLGKVPQQYYYSHPGATAHHHYPPPVPQYHHQPPHQEMEIRELYVKFKLIPLVFVLLRVLDGMFHVYSAYSPVHPVPIPGWYLYLMIFGDASQGLFNCIIFVFLTRKIRMRIWEVFSSGCCGWLCCCCCSRCCCPGSSPTASSSSSGSLALGPNPRAGGDGRFSGLYGDSNL